MLAVVTGAASGLGRGLVHRLRERGDDVVALDVAEADHGEGVRTVRCDVADAGALLRVRDELGPVDLLFNNAGIVHAEPARVVAVNLVGVLNGVEAFVPGMRERGVGRIVNTASLLAVRPSGRRAVYAATKAGVIAYSLGLRDELAGTGVGVSIVLPHVRSAIEDGDPDGPEAAYVAAGADPLDAAADVLAGVDAGDLWVVAGTDPEPVLAQVRRCWP
ncbi:MAG TPA: SDR family NAD(P)-dependent oxidoreductase [Acidimicrobiales bacterium]|nr:SDR family NAD(P)-dependent oxidoreductase [Acidimicrobiales bacterium]